jgi:ABC-type transporter MlaC component
MNGKHRALAALALSLTLAAATAAVAVAATPPTGIEDHNDRLLRNLQATQAERTQAAVAQARTMERDLAATAAVVAPAPVEDQNDRLLRNLQAVQAEGTQDAVARARAMERNLAPTPAVDVVAAQPIVRPDVAAPGAGVDVLATLLLGLVGGLVGGGAAIGGWTIATRRRVHRVAATV